MLANILFSLVSQATHEDLVRLLTTQNVETLKTMLQCFIVVQYCNYDFNKQIVSILNEWKNNSNEKNKQIELYNTSTFNENEKQTLSMFENSLQLCLSRTRSLLDDIILLVLSYFDNPEIYQKLSLVNKQWCNMSQKYKRIFHFERSPFFKNEAIQRLNGTTYIDFRREEDGKFVKAKCVVICQEPLKIQVLHSSNIVGGCKSVRFEPLQYSKILAHYQSVSTQLFTKNQFLVKMKDQVIKGKIMDIKLNSYVVTDGSCFGPYVNVDINHWVCGVVYDISSVHEKNSYCNDKGTNNHSHNSNNSNNPNNPNNNNNSISRRHNHIMYEKQPYNSQIPFIVDITAWCEQKFRACDFYNYFNLYSFDAGNKKFFKIEQKMLKQKLILLQHWIHGDFIEEVAPFQSRSPIEEQKKALKLASMLLAGNI